MKIKSMKSFKRLAVAGLLTLMSVAFVGTFSSVHAASGSSTKNAIPIKTTGIVRGSLNKSNNYTRWYTFTTSQKNAYYTFKFVNSGENVFSATQYNRNKKEINTIDSVYPHKEDVFDDLKSSKKRKHYIKVSSKYPTKFVLYAKKLNDNAGDTAKKAKLISLDENAKRITTTGRIEVKKDVDWFKFKAPVKGSYTFQLINSTDDDRFNGFIYNRDVVKYTDYSLSAGQHSSDACTFKIGKGCTRYIRISGEGNTGKYKLRITHVADPGYLNASSAYTELNNFRTTKGVSYWNQDNKTKTILNTNSGNTLTPLKRNVELETTAKIRAKEIATNFSGTRPDGTKCFTAYPNLKYRGENRARGTDLTGVTATNLFKDNDKQYEKQGCRRRMLNSKYNAVGIAGYTVNGKTYWVQSFGTE